MRSSCPRAAATGAASVAVAVIALALGACGDDDDGGAQQPADEVRKAFTRLQSALYGGDASAACAAMTPTARAELGARSVAACERIVAGLQEGLAASEDPRPRVVGVEVDGDTAVVVTRKTPGRPALRARFVREGDKWRAQSGLFAPG